MKFSVATLLEVLNYTSWSDINENQLVCAVKWLYRLVSLAT